MPDRFERKHADADPVWATVSLAIDEHRRRERPRQDKLWAYYRNPIEPVGASGATSAGSWYRQAQEAGLPTRIRGRSAGVPGAETGRREVVIENDIAWRVQTMVDFMFGRPVRFESLADDTGKRQQIEHALEQVWERSGGIAMMQDAALLGHVFGHVDLLVRVDAGFTGDLPDAINAISIEPVDPRRAVPVLSPNDYRRLDAYAVCAEQPVGTKKDGRTERVAVTEVFTPGRRSIYRDGKRTASERAKALADAVPVVHIQNMAQPFAHAGAGEVEPLVPLQDELNTRLSDRANRVTLQSFRMYLAKGLESFDATAIAPGMVWTTNNPDASIHPFGGDLYNPGEESHIAEIREAIDKVSGVPPIAAGVVRAKIGNLSSANALRVTLMGLIAKTERKRIAYGRGMEHASALVLRALDELGVLPTTPAERAVRTVWPGFVFEDEPARLDAAERKRDLGIDQTRVLGELGYAERDPGIV